MVSAEIKRTKSLCQGSSDTPKILNHVFDEDVLDFVKCCRRKKWGFPISKNSTGQYDEFLPIIDFADNVWIFGEGVDGGPRGEGMWGWDKSRREDKGRLE